MEKILSPLEKKFADVLGKIIESENLDGIDVRDGFYIRMFALLQEARTKDARDSIYKPLTNFFVDNVLKPNLKADLREKGVTEDLVDDLEITDPADHIRGLLGALTGVEAISDLRLVLILNQTKTNFITSDSPIIKNNYIEIKDYSLIGEQSPGLQIIFPISPKITLILIDSRAYKIDCDNSRIIKLSKQVEIDVFNIGQVLNCESNLFFFDENDKDYIKNILMKNASLKDEKKLTQLRKKTTSQEDREKMDIIHLFVKGINHKIKIPGIKLNHEYNRKLKGKAQQLQKKGQIFPLNRDSKLAEKAINRYKRALERGKILAAQHLESEES